MSLAKSSPSCGTQSHPKALLDIYRSIRLRRCGGFPVAAHVCGLQEDMGGVGEGASIQMGSAADEQRERSDKLEGQVKELKGTAEAASRD